MTQELWTEVDRYIDDTLVHSDDALQHALRACAEAGLPSINVAANQGKFLQLLARARAARNILEIGTLGGYSTIWLARALPADGRLITLENNPKHAEVARANLAHASLAQTVEVRVGSAVDTLALLASDGSAPFDFIFIDADKNSYPDYFQWSVKLSRRGTLIVADNVIRKGAVVDSHSSDPNVQGVRRMHELIAADARVSATSIQTVGLKGHDGITLMIVDGE